MALIETCLAGIICFVTLRIVLEILFKTFVGIWTSVLSQGVLKKQ